MPASAPASTPASTLTEHTFEAEHARLFASARGEGRPIVFLHGGLADHRAALFRVGHLTARSGLRLITPDLRGSGRSIFHGEISWDQLADDVAALLDHLGLERAIVGGTSMGSGVALRFALRHAARLDRLLLLSPFYPGADRPIPEAAAHAMQVMRDAGERALAVGIDALRPLFAGLPSPVRELATEMMLGFDPASVAATTRFLASGAQPMPSITSLAAIEAPVLLVPGTDAQHPAAIASLYAAHLPRAVEIDPSSSTAAEQIAAFCQARG